VAGGGHQGAGIESSAAAQDRPDIVGIGDLVEQHHRSSALDLVEARLGQGIGLDHDALMDRIRPSQPVEGAGLDDLRRGPGPALERRGEPLGGVARHQHAADLTAGVGKGGDGAVIAEKQVRTCPGVQRTRDPAGIASARTLMSGLFVGHPTSYIERHQA
jgi:hypothetical protein